MQFNAESKQQMILVMSRDEIINRIIEYLKIYQPKKIGIFGSFARNENVFGSDIDILVDLKTNLTLLKLVKIERELFNILGVKVDVVTENSLKNKKLRKYIEKDLQIIYQ